MKDDHYNHLLGWYILGSKHPMFKHLPLPKFKSVKLELPPEPPRLIYTRSPQPIVVGGNDDDDNNSHYIHKCKCPWHGAWLSAVKGLTLTITKAKICAKDVSFGKENKFLTVVPIFV
jgi:hypothetical protein